MEQLTHADFERQRIEAEVLIPMVRAFQRAVGKERASEVARVVILELARKDGERWAKRFGTDLAALEQVIVGWSTGSGLDIQRVDRSADRLDFDVVRCPYAEVYKELGLTELGYLLHCTREFGMVEGFSPNVTLQRTQTMMEGASHCDFRFTRTKTAG